MRAALALALCLALAAGRGVGAQTVLEARLTAPTLRYDHAVLGDAREWGALELVMADCPGCAPRRVTHTLPQTRVFEDVTARVADVDGDGQAEVVVVETDLALGASLAVWGAGGRLAATGFIGAPHRWLAPAGIADFDGDGRVEIAYVDRPHLRRELVIVRMQRGRLVEVARAPGLTNHRIGDRAISGGVRDCGQGAELVLASADWTQTMVLRHGAAPVAVGPVAVMAQALACKV